MISKENRSLLIRLNSLNIRSKIWRRSLNKFFVAYKVNISKNGIDGIILKILKKAGCVKTK